MALNAEIIKSNEGLKSLSDDQINEIVTLSNNDENVVIGTKTKEIYDGLDKDLNEVSGLEKEANEKTYSFAKRVVSHFKEQSGESDVLQNQISELKNKVTGYEKQIKEGAGDSVLKQKLSDTESKMVQLQNQYDTLKSDFDKKGTEHNEVLRLTKVNSTVDRVAANLKFKSEYPDNVQKVLLGSAKDKINSTYKADVIEEGGKEILVFRNDKGEIARNPENKLEPYTAEDLLKTELKDVLDLGKKATGTGTKPPEGGAEIISLVDLGGSKTQIEADDLIERHLLQKGFTKTGSFEGASKFQEEFSKIRIQHKVQDLPIR